MLCTICLSPADYGDMSDVSLENGSSDESTDGEDDDINLKLLRNNDNEKTKLIKKSPVDRKYTIQKRNKEGGQNEACDTLSNDYKTFNNRSTANMKERGIKMNMSDANIRTHNYSTHKIYDSKDIKNTRIKNSPKSEYCKLRLKFKTLSKLKRKYKSQSNETKSRRNFCRLFATFLQYLGLTDGCKFSSNAYNIQTSTKSVKVYKTTHTTKLGTNLVKECKAFRRSTKLINKNVNQRPSLKLLYAKRTKPCSPKIIEFILTKNSNNFKNVTENSNNKKNNKNGKIKKKQKSKRSNDKEPKKSQKKINVEKKQCCRRIKKIHSLCSSCFLNLKRKVTPSKELLDTFKKKNYAYSKNKFNFKRRKKEKKHDNEKSNKTSNESENSRNYRISSYLFDNCWTKGRFSKDSQMYKFNKENALKNLGIFHSVTENQQAQEKKRLEEENALKDLPKIYTETDIQQATEKKSLKRENALCDLLKSNMKTIYQENTDRNNLRKEIRYETVNLQKEEINILKKKRALSELLKLRMEAITQQVKEIKILEKIKKCNLNIASKCSCPAEDCVCTGNPKNIHEGTKLFQKVNHCNVWASHSELVTNDKKKNSKIFSTNNADPNITRRIDFYRSLGVTDFGDINPNLDIDDAPCQNNETAKKTLHPSIENTPTAKSSRGIKLEFEKLSGSIKLVKIKEVKL